MNSIARRQSETEPQRATDERFAAKPEKDRRALLAELPDWVLKELATLPPAFWGEITLHWENGRVVWMRIARTAVAPRQSERSGR